MGKKRKNTNARRVVNNGQSSAKNTLVRRAVNQAGGGKKVDLNSAMHYKKHMNEDCRAYCDLVSDPWHPKEGWEKVHNPQYSNGQGKVSQTFRCAGWIEHSISANTTCIIQFQPNPGTLEADANTALSGNYAVGGLIPTATKRGIPGCPPYESVNSYQGNAGILRESAGSGAFGTFNATVTDSDTVLAWGTPTIQGSQPSAPGQFAYRCVAAGIIVTPTGKNQDLRGLEISTLLPEDNAIGVAGTKLPFEYANCHKQRSDRSMSLTWLPSNNDIHFCYPTDASSTVNVSTLLNQRAQIQLFNADASATYGILVQYVAFYEVAGQCISNTGNYSDCMPRMGAQIFNGMKGYEYDGRKMRTESIQQMGRLGQPGSIHPKSDKVPFGKHITAQVIKALPKVEKIADKRALDKPAASKSFFSELWDTAKGILPAVVPELLALL